MKMKKMENKSSMRFILSEWKLYIASLKMMRYQEDLDNLVENKAKDQEILAKEVLNLEKAENEANTLTVQLQTKHSANKTLSEKNAELNEYLNHQIPAMFR